MLDKLEKLNSIFPEHEYYIVSEIKQLCGGSKQDIYDLIYLLMDSDIIIKSETDNKLRWSCGELRDNFINELKNSIEKYKNFLRIEKKKRIEEFNKRMRDYRP